MCRNIRPLFNFDPPASDEEIREASLQYVRKISGIHKPSRANEAIFQAAVDKIAIITQELITSLETSAPARNRAVEAEKRRARSTLRFSKLLNTD